MSQLEAPLPVRLHSLDLMPQSIYVLNYLMSNYLVESDKYDGVIRVHVRPGVLESSAIFDVKIEGACNFTARGSFFKFQVWYRIWPKEKRTQMTSTLRNANPGNCRIASDGTIWIDLPFIHQLREGTASVDLFPFGGNQPRVPCQHVIKKLHTGRDASEEFEYRVTKRETFSAVDKLHGGETRLPLSAFLHFLCNLSHHTS